MTATPEEQAKSIVNALRGRRDGWQWGEYIIASAIRQAEDAKLEQAAVRAELGLGKTATAIAAEIRRLKHGEGTR